MDKLKKSIDMDILLKLLFELLFRNESKCTTTQIRWLENFNKIQGDKSEIFKTGFSKKINSDAINAFLLKPLSLISGGGNDIIFKTKIFKYLKKIKKSI